MFDYSKIDKSVYIQQRYPVTDKEFQILNEKYGNLCWFAANKLMISNHRTDDDLQDFHSEIQIGMIRAGSYHKRQKYIEAILRYLNHCKLFMTVKEIEFASNFYNLWTTKTKRASLGKEEEDKLIGLVKKYEGCAELEGQKLSVPNSNQELSIDREFEIYCKAIIWNTEKAIGHLLSEENKRRSKEISLDEWGFLEGGEVDQLIDEGISYTPDHFIHDFDHIRKQLHEMDDKRPAKVFDILTDSYNHNSIFKKKKGKKEGIKINVVRKKTNMSYRTINKQLKIIKNLLEEELL